MNSRSRKILFLGVEHGRCVGLTNLSPSVSRLSRQYGNLNNKQPYETPWPVTGIAFLYCKFPMIPMNETSPTNQYHAHKSPSPSLRLILLLSSNLFQGVPNFSFRFSNQILYFSILLHCIVQWVLQVMLPSSCSFIVLVFIVFHCMFRPTWPSSSV
jgi:hypothetical protein